VPVRIAIESYIFDSASPSDMVKGDGGLCLHLDHVGDRVHRLRARLLRPCLPPRHDGRHQLQLDLLQ